MTSNTRRHLHTLGLAPGGVRTSGSGTGPSTAKNKLFCKFQRTLFGCLATWMEARAAHAHPLAITSARHLHTFFGCVGAAIGAACFGDAAGGVPGGVPGATAAGSSFAGASGAWAGRAEAGRVGVVAARVARRLARRLFALVSSSLHRYKASRLRCATDGCEPVTLSRASKQPLSTLSRTRLEELVCQCGSVKVAKGISMVVALLLLIVLHRFLLCSVVDESLGKLCKHRIPVS